MQEKKTKTIRKPKPPKTEDLGNKSFQIMPSMLDMKKTIQDIFVTPRTCWAPSGVRGALDQHDVGMFSASGRLVDAMMRDAWIFACNNTLIYGVLSLNDGWRWKEDYKVTKEDEDRLKITKKWWAKFMESAVPATMLKWVANIGFSVLTKAWNISYLEDKEYYVPDIHVIHPSNIYWNTATKTYYVMTYSHGVVELDEHDPRMQLIKHVDSERPFYQGAVRPLGLVWIDKWAALSDWRALNGTFGNPLRILTTDREFSTPPEFDIEIFIRTLAQSMQYGSPVHLMTGQTLELQQITASSADLFKDKIAQCDKEISLVYLGQNLTTDVKGGSFAAAKVHENVKADYIEAYTKTLNQSLYTIVKEFYLYNFGEGVEVPCPYFNPAQPENELEIAKINTERANGLKYLSEALEKLQGITINSKPLIDIVNIEKLLGDFGANKEQEIE